MTPIQKALSEIQFKIPKEILEAAFIEDQPFRAPVATNLEYQIRSRVIDERVLVDLNLAGGMLHMVPMDRIKPEFVDEFQAVFRIPKELTQGRSISRVLAMAYGDQRAQGNYIQSTVAFNTQMSAVQGVLNSHVGIAMTETTSVSLIAENTVLLTDMLAVPGRTHLRCYLDNDPALSQMRAPVIPVFAELVTLAVKSFIYNTLIMKIGRDVMVGGRDLGKFKEIVESYADADELYTNFLREKWRKVNMFNNTLARQRMTRLASPGWG